MTVMTQSAKAAPRTSGKKDDRRRSIKDDNKAGWLFVTPVLIILGIFLVLPILMVAWVAVSDWTGRGSPFSGDVNFVGLKNFQAVLTDGGLATRDFGTALRNNIYYVALVVPLQTIVALMLAVFVNTKLFAESPSSAWRSTSPRSRPPLRSPFCGSSCSTSRVL